MPQVKRECLTFTVIGGGFSGVETVGEMKDLIERSLPSLSQHRSERDPDPAHRVRRPTSRRIARDFGGYAKAFFEKRGIEVLLRTGIKSATGTAIVTSDDQVIGTRTVVATIGNAPSPMVAKLDLPNDRGRVRTDRTLRIEGFEDVWALGDAALIPLVETPSAREHYAPDRPVHDCKARHLARNLEAAMEGKPVLPSTTNRRARWRRRRWTRRADVYEVRLSGFPAWLLWRTYYLSFVPGFATKVRIAAQWLLDMLLGRSTVQTGTRPAQGTRYVRYRAHDRVFEHGNRADGFYAVVEGAFELRIRGEDGSERERVIGPGGHFGERAPRRRPADRHYSRLGGLSCTRSKRGDFQRLARVLPPLRQYFEQYVAAEFRSAS